MSNDINIGDNVTPVMTIEKDDGGGRIIGKVRRSEVIALLTFYLIQLLLSLSLSLSLSISAECFDFQRKRHRNEYLQNRMQRNNEIPRSEDSKTIKNNGRFMHSTKHLKN